MTIALNETLLATESPTETCKLPPASTLPYWNAPDPLYYIDRWPLAGLDADAQDGLCGTIASLHAGWLSDRTGTLKEPEIWERAYHIIARHFASAGLLTANMVERAIPSMVADASASARWVRWMRHWTAPSTELPFAFGSEYYDPGQVKLFLKLIEACTYEWNATLRLKARRAKSTVASDTNSAEAVASKTRQRQGEKSTRRNPVYEEIDSALTRISAMYPKGHQEVFRYLQGWKVPLPNRSVFKKAHGWMRGCEMDRSAASAWLSQAWRRLNLPAFVRGPKTSNFNSYYSQKHYLL